MVAAGIAWIIGAAIAAAVFLGWLALHGLLALIRFVNWLVFRVIVPAVKGLRR